MSAMSIETRMGGQVAPTSRTSRPRANGSALRLTRRGRAVLLLFLLVAVLAAFALGRASTASAGSARRAAPETVVVQPGETLWQIARRVAPGTDPRHVVDRLVEINDLGVRPLRAGQELRLP